MDWDALLKALKKNEFDAQLFENREDLINHLLQAIPEGENIGMGGSKTIEALGLYDILMEKGHPVHWHWRTPKEHWTEVKGKARHSPVYICSANAISMDGKIVQMDGASNRVSAMVYGPRDLYLIVGQNKVCKDLESARQHIFDVVSPKIAKMVDYRTPCKTTGKCADCSSPDRCCRVEVILHKKPREVNVHILFLPKELGF